MLTRIAAGMGFNVMTETIADVSTAHRAGKRLVETIAETYRAHRRATPIPRCSSSSFRRRRRWRSRSGLQAAGPEGKPLFGVPFAVKDNIDVAGLPTTAACPAFAYRPERSAFVVEKLERAGAIVIGKTNLDQFATGLVGVRSPYGVPRNALRADLIPGGSSSGSATAVGAGLVPFSLGTDTAGSGRVPAALNGIVGLKPSLGALSATGVVPACRTLDTISIFALDVADAFAAFAVAAATMQPIPRRAAFPRPRLSARRAGCASASRAGSAANSSATRRPRRPSPRDVAQARGARRAKSSSSTSRPFAEVARLLYEGPWVAERYAATKPLIETNPDALHPVTRAIIEGARKFDAVAAFEAIYKLAALRRDDRGRLAAIRRDAGADDAAPLHGRRGAGRPDRAQFAARRPTPISSTCSISPPSPFPRACAATACRRA